VTSTTPAGRHQDLGRGAAGTALARIAAARITGLPPRATAPWIRAMTAGPVTANASASLFYGALAVAFVLHTAALPAYAAMLAALDQHVNDLTALKLAAAHEPIDRGELARPSEYDLISGLTGLGLYHLVRHGSAGSGMTAAVLEYLVALAEPVRRNGESLPGWWSGTPGQARAPTYRERVRRPGAGRFPASPLSRPASACPGRREGRAADGGSRGSAGTVSRTGSVGIASIWPFFGQLATRPSVMVSVVDPEFPLWRRSRMMVTMRGASAGRFAGVRSGL